MHLMYVDESGSTGTDYDNNQQPIFCLAGICIQDCKWHEINNEFEKEKVKICPEFKDNEIHASELFNASKSSIYKKYTWTENLATLEKIVDLITSLEITIYYNIIDKQDFKKHIYNRFNNSIKLDPYLYAFGNIYYLFNDNLQERDSYGIIFSDEIQSVSDSLELLYPKLKENNTKIIEKSLYLDSKKNNFIQIADVCALYLNKYMCIKQGYHIYNEIKQEHCINMYKKISKKMVNFSESSLKKRTKEDIDNLFK